MALSAVWCTTLDLTEIPVKNITMKDFYTHSSTFPLALAPSSGHNFIHNTLCLRPYVCKTFPSVLEFSDNWLMLACEHAQLGWNIKPAKHQNVSTVIVSMLACWHKALHGLSAAS